MKIIPAIDIIDGQVVRLVQGDYGQQTTYSKSPVDLAKSYEDAGMKMLHLVDLDGAKAGKVINIKVLESICNQTNLVVDFGGGVKTTEDLERVFNAGANQVTGGSIAVKNRELFQGWIDTYGADKLILGTDVHDGKIAINGWETTTDTTLDQFIESYPDVKYTLCTDISKDGMLQGPAIELYKDLGKKFPDLNVVASGGVSGIQDIKDLVEIDMYGVVIGKALLEGRITLKELEPYV